MGVRGFSVLPLVLGLGVPVAAQAPRTQGPPSPPAPSPAANTPLPLDGIWNIYAEPMVEGGFFSGSWEWTSSMPVTFTITDLYVVTDAYVVHDFGVPFASTPLLSDWTSYGSDPFGPPWEADPDVAFESGAFSAKKLYFPAGSHSVTIQDVQIPPTLAGPPFPDGTVAFKAEPCAALAASEVVRLGEPPNPNALMPGMTGGPTIGEVWQPVVVPFIASPILDVLMISLGPPINQPVPGLGTLLCTLPALHFRLSGPPGVPFTFPLPLKCNAIGLDFVAQAAEVNAVGAIFLTNALDCTVGSL